MKRLVSLIFSSLGIFGLSACSGIGQLSVRSERNEYNDVIKETTTEQLLQNVVRAKYYESPSFFDVMEIDQTKSISGSVTSGSANIGAALRLYSLTPAVSMTDSPILKYQPPSSAGYIAQILNPISLASIAKFNNSNANLVPLLVFSTNRLTPDFIDYDRAIDLIDLLDTFGAINFEARPDGQLALVRKSGGILTPKAAHMTDDPSLACFANRNPNMVVADLWTKLSIVFGQPGATTILLHTPDTKATGGTVVLTRAALGSLRLAEAHDIDFVSKEEAERIVERNTKNSLCFNGEYYYTDNMVTGERIEQEWVDRVRLASGKSDGEEVRDEERTLGHNRVLMIVEKTPDQPANAYVSVYRDGMWYSIADNDDVSKMNFALLGNIMIVQAQAPQQPTTQTVITAAH
jgi:(2Fe-2S) ferredoxin